MERKDQERSSPKAGEATQPGRWEWDIVADRVQWTEESYHMFGYKPEEIELDYDTIIGRVHPEDRERMQQALQSTLNGIRPYDIKFQIVRPDGNVRIIHARGEVLRDADGKPIRMVGTNLDITERKQRGK